MMSASHQFQPKPRRGMSVLICCCRLLLTGQALALAWKLAEVRKAFVLVTRCLCVARLCYAPDSELAFLLGLELSQVIDSDSFYRDWAGGHGASQCEHWRLGARASSSRGVAASALPGLRCPPSWHGAETGESFRSLGLGSAPSGKDQKQLPP